MTNTKIHLHKEFGLNPTMPICFYCGKETGEIALLGAAYKGEAPKHMCLGIEPCQECEEKFKEHFVFVEVKDNYRKNPEPTGRWVAIKKEHLNYKPLNDISYVGTDFIEQLKNK